MSAEDIVGGFIFGAFLGAIVSMVMTSSNEQDYWKVEALSHGYAHYDKDHTFHWNDEKENK